MTRSLSIVLVAFAVLLALPLCLGIGGGLIGLTFGLIGALFGLLFGLFGAIIGCIGWILKMIFHLLFGWHSDFGFHHGFHFNVYVFAAIVILIVAVASKRKN